MDSSGGGGISKLVSRFLRGISRRASMENTEDTPPRDEHAEKELATVNLLPNESKKDNENKKGKHLRMKLL